jgi:hypothetical protein
MSDKFRLCSLAILLACISMAPRAKADESSKEAMVTFSAPVAVPGQVLTPGRYVFRLVNSQSDRPVVQIFTEEPRELVVGVPAIPAYRLQSSDENLITFEDRLMDNPEAVKRWFCPGQLAGVALVYPDRSAAP